jgi:hypothetical protein
MYLVGVEWYNSMFNIIKRLKNSMYRNVICFSLGWYTLGLVITALCITLTGYLFEAQNIIMNLKEQELLWSVNLTCLVIFSLLSLVMIVIMVALGLFLLLHLTEMIYDPHKKELEGNLPLETEDV